MIKTPLILIVLLYAQLALCTGKDVYNRLEFERIDSRSGLSSDVAKKIFQDTEGYLWITTEDGLNRFDGYNIKTYKPEYHTYHSFTSPNTMSICEDRSGRLWIGTLFSGINIFDKKTGNVAVFEGVEEQNIPSKEITSLLCDSKGDVWIGAYGGLCKYIFDEHKLVIYNTDVIIDDSIPVQFITSIYEDSRNRILIGTFGNGLLIHDSYKKEFTRNLISENDISQSFTNRIYSIYEDNKNKVWLGTWEGGLIKTTITEDNQIHIIEHYNHNPGSKNSLLGDIIYDIDQDIFGNIWIATPYGLNIIEITNNCNIFHTYTHGDNIYAPSNIEVFDIFKDRSGIMWISTLGGGINKIDFYNKKFETLPIPEIDIQKKDQAIHSFFIDNNQLYIGVKSLGFGAYDLNSKDFTHYSKINRFKNIPHNLNAVYCFLQDRKGNLWLGTRYNGLYKINRFDEVINYLQNTTDRINDLLEDNFGNLWVGTSNGLYKLVFNSKNESIIYRYMKDTTESSISGNYIYAITQDSDSNIWIGTAGDGLNKLISNIHDHDAAKFEHYKVKKGTDINLKSDIIHSIFEDSKKRIWLGTGGAGMALFDKKNKKFVHYDKNIGIQGDAVYDICEDDSNTLWLSTNKGIVAFKYTNKTDIWLENYTPEDGLQGNIYIKGAMLKDNRSTIYVGGYNGFNVFTPSNIHRNTYVPPLAITDIKVVNKSVTINYKENTPLILSHKDYNFSINFTSLSFSQPGKNKFQYKLEGYDQEWKITDYTRREAYYANLSPGDYTFKVKASNSSGLWNENPVSLKIIVKPAPYKTWWAYTIYVIIFLIILVSIYVGLINNIKIKQAYEIEKIDHAKSEKLHQFKLKFFTNISHEFLTPLSVISSLLDNISQHKKYDEDKLSSMTRNVKKLMRLISQLLDFRKAESGTLELSLTKNDFNKHLAEIIEDFKPLAQNKDIKLQVKGKFNKLIYYDTDKIDKIVSNLLSNAYKYNPKGSEVGLNYMLYNNKGKEELKVEVYDNGIGINQDDLPYLFDRFFKNESITGKTFGAGIGLALTKSLVELHNGTITANNRPEGGAIFTFSIPIDKDDYESIASIEKEVQQTIDDYYISDISLNKYIDSKKLTGNKDHTILIVEDNDDFRKVLYDYLSVFYTVIEATNGSEGLKCINQHYPHLIVSDIMMPEMDGIELCKKVKEDLSVSHTLFVLLTAKTTAEAQFSGYIEGADAYLPKPVNMKVLHARILSLLEQREKLKEKFRNSGLNIEINEIPDIEKQFIDKVNGYITNNIDNTELNVKHLCDSLAVSNSMLYRKLTNLTGKKPVEYIRYIRLIHAANYIKQNYTISEAAYLSGFNNLSYFTNCFKEQFGMVPSKYNKN